MSAVPKLRFPEFDGEWYGSRIGDFFSIQAGGDIDKARLSSIRTEDHPYPVYANSTQRKGLYGYASYYKEEGGCVTVTGRGELGIVNARHERFVPIVRLLVLRPNDAGDVDFLASALGRLNIFVESTGVPQLTGPQISGYRISSTSLPEQQKVASFLSSVDKKIDLLRQKKNALELYKKGLMQKIFSQEVRFKKDDGSDFPDWEEVTVGDMAERHVRGLTSSILDFVDKGYPVYGASGLIGYIDNYISEQRYIGVVKDGAGVGRVFEAVEQSSLLSTMESIIPKAGFSFGFVKQVIKDIDFKKFTTGSTIPHVYFKDYSKESYPCPTYEEQEKIARLLDLFDAKIQKTSSQIDQMETFKKGLLQQMFV